MAYYKLTHQDLTTYNGYLWTPGKWVSAQGSGLQPLCSNGWLHAYQHPLLAVLSNPIHSEIDNPRLWEVEVGGYARFDGQLKCGFQWMRLVRELPVPVITTEQYISFAICCALKVHREKTFVAWAENWLLGADRSVDAANAAADVAYATVNTAAYAAACAADAAAHAADTAAYVANKAAYAAHAAANAANAAADTAYATVNTAAYVATNAAYAAACAMTNAAHAAADAARAAHAAAIDLISIAEQSCV